MDQLGRISAEEFRKSEKIPITVVLDNIRSGLNVGSVFRSADAFRIEKIICCGYSPVPPHREVLKSALGATESVTWSYEEHTREAVISIQNAGVRVLPSNKRQAASLCSNSIRNILCQWPLCWATR